MGARKIRVVVVALLATVFGLTASVLGASPAHAASLPVNPPQVPVVAGNPNPGTDLFASTMAVGTGGTQRICETSQLGIPVYLAEAAQHGSGCENKWEKPAYQTDGRCP
jgi:hypothetical protein